MEEDELEASSLPLKTWHSEVTVSVTGEPPSAVEEDEEDTTNKVEVIPEVIEPLPLLDVLRISAVLEDAMDQLSILNYIMPLQFERKQSTSLQSNNQEKPPMVSNTWGVAATPLSAKEKTTVPEVREGGLEANKIQDLIFVKPTRQTIMTAETLKKIQMDSSHYISQASVGLLILLPQPPECWDYRQYFSDVIANTRQELQESGTYTSLLQALNEERDSKIHFFDVIAREEKGKKQIRSLQKQLINVKKERQAEVQSRNEYIAHLKDQLQEMKAKTNLENQYMKKNTELQISQTQKKCNKAEELLLEEIEKLRMKTEEENRIHMEIEVFLRKEQQKLEEKLEFWMEKFDKDTEAKQNELNALQAAKASDLAHLQDLAKMIREYEQVIIEDRIEKEKTRKKIQQDDLELKSIIKLQAWWRGTVIRKEIGSFKMPKKEKDDTKDSKGKGKDKEKRRGKK
ncbi:dynein regulatory complex protein 9 isoform X2 [Castor canadensis]|uniref:Dynein regulatory complex protein 9 isoform X2 n=3 Tax=Castor canadensis TaxID=51338 RepID=A0AC58MJA0_CASCN